MLNWHRASKQSGFTLIEILLTLAIVAVVTGAVVMSLQSGRSRDADAAIKRLEAKLQYALDDALIGERHIALVSDEKTGYRFVAWDPSKNAWSADPGPELRPDDGRVHLRLAGLGPSDAIRFLPGGETYPFALVLTSGNHIWKIDSDGINIAVTQPNAE